MVRGVLNLKTKCTLKYLGIPNTIKKKMKKLWIPIPEKLKIHKKSTR